MTDEHDDGLPDDIHMLSQPLLTEEGFVNPACMNELENVIASMPETYERLKDDPEWGTKRRWYFVHDITGALAMCAVVQSPWACPEKLEDTIKYLNACLITEHEKLSEKIKHKVSGGHMFALTLCEVNKFLHDILGKFEPVMAWNEPKISNGPGYMNRHEHPHPAFDFVDLSALFRNVCIYLRNEGRRNDAFDKKFEEEQAEGPKDD